MVLAVAQVAMMFPKAGSAIRERASALALHTMTGPWPRWGFRGSTMMLFGDTNNVLVPVSRGQAHGANFGEKRGIFFVPLKMSRRPAGAATLA